MTHPERSVENLALASLLLTVAVTAIHHIFRLGPMLIVPSVVAFVLPIVLMAFYRRSRHPGFLMGYTLFGGLVVLWFGLIDGFLDHVLKAAGLSNMTFLPGSEAEVIATYFKLWSPAATSLLYESTGIATALLSVPTVVFTALLLRRRFTAPRKVAVA